MKVFLVSALSLTLLAPGLAVPANSKTKKKPEADPVTWGVLNRADGCVIFKETRKTDFHFYGIAATEKFYGVLDVIEGQHYQMAQKHWTEDQEGMNQLQRLATSERLTFVKIQEGYSPALLDKARSICSDSLGSRREDTPETADPNAPELKRH